MRGQAVLFYHLVFRVDKVSLPDQHSWNCDSHESGQTHTHDMIFLNYP